MPEYPNDLTAEEDQFLHKPKGGTDSTHDCIRSNHANRYALRRVGLKAHAPPLN